MATPSTPAQAGCVAADAEGHLTELCALLKRAGAGRYRVEPAGRGRPADVGSGWSLTGGVDESERKAAAELVARLYRSELELRSLSAEILERYEEATLVYRLADRLGAVLGGAAVSRLVLEDAAAVLGAPVGEVWLRDGAGLSLAASVPPGRSTLESPESPEALAAMEDGRCRVLGGDDGREPMAVVPLPDPEGAPIGVLVLVGRAEGRPYRTGDVKLLTALASLTSGPSFGTTAWRPPPARRRLASARSRSRDRFTVTCFPHRIPLYRASTSREPAGPPRTSAATITVTSTCRTGA